MSKPQKRRTQTERTEASDKAMFKAAIKLIAQEGPNKMTFAKLGEEAGVSRGLPGYRFGSKSDLLQAVTERILELWEERVVRPAHADEGGVENLERLARLYVDAVVAGSDLMVAQFRLMNESYASYGELKPAFENYDQQVRQWVVDSLEPAQKTGGVKQSVDLESFAVLFIGMLRGTAMQYFINKNAFDIDAAYSRIKETCDMHLIP